MAPLVRVEICGATEGLKDAGLSILIIDVLVIPRSRASPPIADLEREAETYRRVNRLMLRNTNPINFLDGCAVSLPIHAPGDAPVGMMLVGFSGEDERVLSAGLVLEGAVQYTSS